MSKKSVRPLLHYYEHGRGSVVLHTDGQNAIRISCPRIAAVVIEMLYYATEPVSAHQLCDALSRRDTYGLNAYLRLARKALKSVVDPVTDRHAEIGNQKGCGYFLLLPWEERGNSGLPLVELAEQPALPRKKVELKPSTTPRHDRKAILEDDPTRQIGSFNGCSCTIRLPSFQGKARCFRKTGLLIKFLHDAGGTLVSREELARILGLSHTAHVHEWIKHARAALRKLGGEDLSKCIVSVRGKGFYFDFDKPWW